MLIFDANGANWEGSRARSASVSRADFTLNSIIANSSSDMVVEKVWGADDVIVIREEKR